MGDEKITTMAQFIDAALGISKAWGHLLPWWRGHAKCEWELTSSLVYQECAYKEGQIVADFRNRARARVHDCPAEKDYAAWLFLMRHYGLPVRLLDWTESALIALFFAVEDKGQHQHDGCVWGLNPLLLNMATVDRRTICLPDQEDIAPIFAAAFPDRKSGPARAERIVAVAAQHTDLRHLVQCCQFTLHGTSKAISSIPECNDFLQGLVIDKEHKRHLKDDLEVLGITRATVFPDLQNLASQLKDTEYEGRPMRRK